MTPRSDLRYLPIDRVCPFDQGHFAAPNAPLGFTAKDKWPNEHHDGARLVRSLVEQGSFIRPIAVCRMSLVPEERRDDAYGWQRLDGFKRYMGQKLAGVTEILCEVRQTYHQGCQAGQPWTIEGESMGKIIHQLYSGQYDPGAWPWQGRISIEDCETIHVHLGHLRLEFKREQFLELAAAVGEAADTLRRRRGL